MNIETRIIGGQKVPYVTEEVVKINNTDLSVKEFNGQRVVTFKDIDMLHERVEGTSNKRFIDNKKHFIEKEDYFEITGDTLREFKRLPNFRIGEKASKLILITESGYLMLVKSLQDDLAWKVQRELVNNYFRVKEVVQSLNTSELSPELQMFKQIFDTVVKQQLENKQIKAAVEETKEEIQGIRDIVAINSTNWRKDTSALINKMALKLGGYENINILREESYRILEERAHTRLSVKLTNKRRRMAEEGVCKSKRDKLNKLDVIADDSRLLETYLAIVKEMAIKYGVSIA